MTARQFIARNSREALAMVRSELGPDAVILQNRTVPGGVAVTAMLEKDLPGLQAADRSVPAQAVREPVRPTRPARTRPVQARSDVVDGGAADRGDGQSTGPMSTVSFERYLNERNRLKSAASAPVAVRDSKHPVPGPSRPTVDEPTPAPAPASARRASPVFKRDRDETAHELLQMAGELRQMRSFISEQFSALSWVDGVRRTPAQARLLRRMLDAGFSSRTSRVLIGNLPGHLDEDAADRWLASALAGNLTVAAWPDGLIDGGGVYALVGPTGIGKTTSVAKIAARYALRHGAGQVGLITADAYRVGAQDQLRRFGAMIGITVHAAQDAQALTGLLKMLSRKKLVLIDTAGLGQRDPRVPELLDAVTRGSVQRLLVLSAAAQVQAIEESILAYEGAACAGVLLTKIDEACRLGGALDVLIRSRMTLMAIGNGQRVPEDWAEPDGLALVEQALKAGTDDRIGLPDLDLTMLMQRAEPTGEPPERDADSAIRGSA